MAKSPRPTSSTTTPRVAAAAAAAAKPKAVPAATPGGPSSVPADAYVVGLPPRGLGRIPVTKVAPVVEGGAYPAKAVVGELLPVTARVFREGHDAVNANVVLRGPKGVPDVGWIPMVPGEPGTDRWSARVAPTAEGDWTFHVEAWSDPMASWRHVAEIKIGPALRYGVCSRDM